MEIKVIRKGPWMAGVSIFVVLLIGGMVGSILTARTGRAPFGMGSSTPMWLATASPVQSGEVSVVLGELPAQAAESGAKPLSPSAALEGISVDDLTPQIAQQLGLPAKTFGVVITGVEQGSSADDAGLERGDVIQEVNHKAVHNVNEFSDAVNRLGKQSVLLLVNRRGNTLYVVVEPD